MTELTPSERRWVETFEEVRSCPDLRVTTDHQEGLGVGATDTPSVFTTLAEQDDVLLDPALQTCYPRFEGLGLSWTFGGEETDPLFAGEFYLSPLQHAIHDQPPTDRYPYATPEEEQLYSALRDFDGTPMAGAGHVSSLRIERGSVHNPEIWFTDMLGIHRMDLDLCGYLDALRITKGTYGWQYLYTDVTSEDDEFDVPEQFLTEMLAVFPELFPHHDYSDLRARLEARL